MSHSHGHTPKQLTFIFIPTFVMGLLAGGFVYFTTRTDTIDTTLERPEKGIEVVGYTYGGCERLGCTTYKIDAEGNYMYIERDVEGGDRRRSGTLPEEQHAALKEYVKETPFSRILNTPFTGTCPAAFDGIAYRYEIRDNDQHYSVDSCKEDLDGAPLFVTLTGYFEIFRTLHAGE